MQTAGVEYRAPVTESYHRPLADECVWQGARGLKADGHDRPACTLQPAELEVRDGADEADFLAAREQPEERRAGGLFSGIQGKGRRQHGEHTDQVIRNLGIEVLARAPERRPEAKSAIERCGRAGFRKRPIQSHLGVVDGVT